MKSIGKRISNFRKDKNITQMELADKLGISFQAVSNWERGETMPDISKLPELAQIFDVSIDDILGNKNESIILKNVIEGKTEEYFKENNIPKEEIANIAPILKTEQNDEIIQGIKDKLTIDDIMDMAPFISDAALNLCAHKVYESDGIGGIIKLAPFMEEELIDKYSWESYKDNGITNGLIGMCPFMEDETINKIAFDAVKTYGMKAVKPMLPFIDEDVLDEFVKSFLNK